jgi:hypothetical protein
MLSSRAVSVVDLGLVELATHAVVVLSMLIGGTGLLLQGFCRLCHF